MGVERRVVGTYMACGDPSERPFPDKFGGTRKGMGTVMNRRRRRGYLRFICLQGDLHPTTCPLVTIRRS